MRYEDLVFKIPQESPTYSEDSALVIQQRIFIGRLLKING